MTLNALVKNFMAMYIFVKTKTISAWPADMAALLVFEVCCV